MLEARGYIGSVLVTLALCAGVATFGAILVPYQAEAQVLSEADKAKLRAEYDALQIEIAQWQKVLDEARTKKNTLQGDVTALDAQIKKAETEIRSRNNTISRLAGEINEKNKNITALELRIQEGLESLAKLMREKHEVDAVPLAIVMLSSENLSAFFSTADSIDSINRDLQDHFNELRGVKTQTQKEKEELAERQAQEQDARYEIQRKQAAIAEDKKEKNSLLKIAKQEESSYSQVLAERQRRAETIRNALFELRDAEGISFASALQYATQAEKSTGVRAAFILAILRQESNLGINVGQCLLVDATTGAGKGKNTGTPFSRVMRADATRNDVAVFLDLMSRLGKDPYATPVSCPQSVGYGGAMGPSQFIPTTWKGLESRLAPLLGVSIPNPWIPQHAIMATALFLKELRADRGTPSAEIEAAGRYYAGGSWKTLGANYSKSVMSFADKYQNDIDFLNDL